MRPLRLALLLALALVPAQAASAASVSTDKNGHKLVILAGPGEQNRLTVTQSGSAFTVEDAAGLTVGTLEQGACVADGARRLLCDVPDNYKVKAELGDGRDEAILAGAAKGSLKGDDGDDVLTGGESADELEGGAGDDRLRGNGGADELHGGDGRDVADYAGAAVAVSVDPEPVDPATGDAPADDGAAGEGDRVALDVEGATGGEAADVLTAGPGGGVLDGGAGDDTLNGDGGADELRGGAGRDTFSAGGGDDHVLLRDGLAETAACGDGADRASADLADAPASDCEHVDRGFGLAPPAPPVAGRHVAIARAGGAVRVRLPGARRYVPLAAGASVPVGSVLDARRGKVELTAAADLGGRTQTARFTGGVFAVRQVRAARPVTELALTGGDFRSCRRGRARSGARAAAKRRRAVRRLWGSGRGRFRTRGRHASATVRGTVWTVEDRCDGTLVRVTRGVVAVYDRRRNRTKLVRAGRATLVRAPKR
jgi:hypothetical protein